MKRLLLLALLVLSILSCTEKDFEVYSLSLSMERDISLSEDERKEVNRLFINASLSDPGMVYSFRLTSPDADLVWEGGFDGDGEEKVSQPCEITEDAIFPEGTYSILLYSDGGTEHESSAELRYETDLRYFASDGSLTAPCSVREIDGSGNELASSAMEEGAIRNADSVTAYIEYEDQYGNTVNIIQSFPPSDADPSLSV